MGRNRFDETWHRLREWTKGQTQSERLAAQILINEGFVDVDPSHPLGGRDGGKDAVAKRAGYSFVMAVYFPRGQVDFNSIETKFAQDVGGAKKSGADGIAFVTNQELTLGERKKLKALAIPTEAEIYHLERITTILDQPQMAKVREQFLDIEAEGIPIVDLGGKGGTAPGAGGGGGGAIGQNAKGGRGGPGGKTINLGKIGLAPGAGGGGVGAVGDGAIGGEGGGGGDHVRFSLEGDDLARVHHLDLLVGKGGVGAPGEDTIVNICDEDGRVLRSVVAQGGQMGAAAYVPPPNRIPTEDDLKAGLRVSGILAAEFFRMRDGVWTMVHGGWAWIQQTTNPFRVELPLLVEISTGSIRPGSVLKLRLLVRSPTGFQVQEIEQLVTVPDGLVRRTHFTILVTFSGSEPGVWKIEFLAGERLIGEFPLEVRAPDSQSPIE